MEEQCLSNPTTIRLAPASRERVDAAAGRFGVKVSDLIRDALEVKLAEWDIKGVDLTRNTPAGCRRNHRWPGIQDGGSRPLGEPPKQRKGLCARRLGISSSGRRKAGAT